MTTSTLASNRLSPIRCAWLPLLLLAALAAPRAAGFDFINITPVVSTAQESSVAANIRNGVLAISRTGDTTVPLTVSFTVTSVDQNYEGYVLAASGTMVFTYADLLTNQGPGSGTVIIPAGTATVTVSIIPVDNTAVNGSELVDVVINADPTYQFNGNNQASIVIAEGDLTLTASLPVPIAYKQLIPGFLFDVNSSRRGVIAASFNTPTLENDIGGFSPFPPVPPTFPTVPATLGKFMGAQFSGTAVIGSDYNLTYRITGITPTTTGSPSFTPTTAWTSAPNNRPGPGFGTSRSGSTATSYNVVAYLRGFTGPISMLTPQIPPTLGGASVQTTILVGDNVTFSDDPNHTYKVISLSGGLTIELLGNPGFGLQSNLHNGVAITDVGQTGVVGFAVSAPYTTGTTAINVENGANGFHYGDAFQFVKNTPNDPASYVCTGFTFNTFSIPGFGAVATSDGILFFEPYYNAPLSGLNVAITTSLAINTEFPITLSANGQTPPIVIPARSTQIQFGITPIESGSPTGMRTVTAQLLGNDSFNLNNPALETIEIADDASTGNVNRQADATSPNIGGSFLVSFTSPFPVPVTIPYTIIAGPGAPASIGTDFIISGLTAVPGSPQTGFGSVVLPAGATSVTIPVTPVSSLLVPETVTLSLSPSLDYQLASGTTTSVNPTATINILPSLGTIGITTSTVPGTVPTMSIAATGMVAPLNCGRFTITNANATAISPPILVNFAISSTASLGIDYQILDASFNIIHPSAGSNPVFQATIPAGQASVFVYVQPLYNPSAAASFTVNASMLAGQAYQQSLNQASLSVTVFPQTVTAAAIGDASVGAGALTTNFTITSTNPGSPVTVAFSFPAAAGTATYGTDFTATFNPANIVVAGSTPGSFIATFGASGQLSIEIVGLSNNAASYPLPVVLEVDSGTGYQLQATSGASTITTSNPPALLATVNLQQSAAVLLGQNKPTPGQLNSGSGGGCGLGSGAATLIGLGLAMLALTLVRRRR